jgi:abortive infection bacteriophage resistance protein
MMEFTKTPLNIVEQIELIKLKGISIEDDAFARRVLTHVYYHRLQAYCFPYEIVGRENIDKSSHSLISGKSFKHVFKLYTFDRSLRLLLLEAIEIVEIALRAHFVQVLAEKYGSHAYLKPDIFYRLDTHANCIASLDKQLLRTNEALVNNYRAAYKKPPYPPIWAVSELLTLGGLSRWLENIKKRQDRQAVAQKLKLDEVVARSFSHHLTHVRNICAHHGRIWNRKFTLTMRLPSNPVSLSSQFNKNSFDQRKVFNTLVILCWCAKTIDPETTWPARLKALLKTRSDKELGLIGVVNGWADFELFS